MPSRVTEWRHRTGRCKHRRPHGRVDYKAVAIHLARRFFRDVWQNYREDLKQEIEILVIEAEQIRRIRGTRKNYGNGRDRIGIVLYSRAVQARFYQVRKAYGLDRNKTVFSLIEKTDSLKINM